MKTLIALLVVMPSLIWAGESDNPKESGPDPDLPSGERALLKEATSNQSDDTNSGPSTPQPSENPPPAKPEKEQVRQICFVLDTTGSMSGLIEGAKQKIWSIAHDVIEAEPNTQLQFGLVAYRDRGDEYVTRVFPLTADLDAFYADLYSLQAKGGGDQPESVNQALSDAMGQMQWTIEPHVIRTLFLVGDAPPHMDYQDDVAFRLTCTHARKQGIRVNTIQCGSIQQTRPFWEEIAALGGGRYIELPQSGNIQVIKTPYDKKLYDLQIQINATVIPYGAAHVQEKTSRKLGLLGLLGSSTVADRSSYMDAAESDAVVTGGGDLVSEVQAGRVDLNELSESDLPADYKDMNREQLKDLIAQNQARRAALQAQVRELNMQREAFLEEHTPTDEETFELNAFEVITEQSPEP